MRRKVWYLLLWLYFSGTRCYHYLRGRYLALHSRHGMLDSKLGVLNNHSLNWAIYTLVLLLSSWPISYCSVVIIRQYG
ncbi:hypothetical protein V8C40DRAFT_230452 [Trichoderma camerunense]